MSPIHLVRNASTGATLSKDYLPRVFFCCIYIRSCSASVCAAYQSGSCFFTREKFYILHLFRHFCLLCLHLIVLEAARCIHFLLLSLSVTTRCVRWPISRLTSVCALHNERDAAALVSCSTSTCKSVHDVQLERRKGISAQIPGSIALALDSFFHNNNTTIT